MKDIGIFSKLIKECLQFVYWLRGKTQSCWKWFTRFWNFFESNQLSATL